MGRILEPKQGANGSVLWELDGAPLAAAIRIQHVIRAGGVWIDGVPQHDITYIGLDGIERFTVPAASQAPDWYERLGNDGPFAFVDWDDEAFVESVPMLQEEALRRHPGREAIGWVLSLRGVSRLLQGNASELVTEIGNVDFRHPAFGLEYEDEGGTQPAQPRRDQDAGPVDDFERLLHNFLSALMTRVDLVRVLVRDEWGPPSTWMERTYPDKRSEIMGADGLHDFLQGLRNYTLHKQLPKSIFTMNLAAELRVDVCLDATHLLQTGDWKPAAKRWLTEQGKQVSIGPAVQAYAERAHAMDEWLEAEFRADRKPLIDEYVARATAYRNQSSD